jgi:hypothetical protein
MVPAGVLASSVYIIARGVKWGVAVAGLYGIFHGTTGCAAAPPEVVPAAAHGTMTDDVQSMQRPIERTRI